MELAERPALGRLHDDEGVLGRVRPYVHALALARGEALEHLASARREVVVVPLDRAGLRLAGRRRARLGGRLAEFRPAVVVGPGLGEVAAVVDLIAEDVSARH